MLQGDAPISLMILGHIYWLVLIEMSMQHLLQLSGLKNWL